MKKKVCWALDPELLTQFEEKCGEVGLKYGAVAEKLISRWLKIGTKVLDNQLNKAVNIADKELEKVEKEVSNNGNEEKVL